MPSKNSRKTYVANSFYHAYNRGVEKRQIFFEDEDYRVFLNLLKRHLAKEYQKDVRGRIYQNYHNDLELLAFCLMPNHYHLLFYLKEDSSVLQNFMRLVANAYSSYFNRKYDRIGHLFQDRFKASHILMDDYLQHISRYIHLNPKEYKSYEWSSLPYFLGKKQASWIKPDRIIELFNSVQEYEDFTDDYISHKEMLDEVKHELANF